MILAPIYLNCCLRHSLVVVGAALSQCVVADTLIIVQSCRRLRRIFTFINVRLDTGSESWNYKRFGLKKPIADVTDTLMLKGSTRLTWFLSGRTQAQWSIDAVIRHTVVTLSAATQVDIGAFLTVHSLEHLLVEFVFETRARVSVGRRVIDALAVE